MENSKFIKFIIPIFILGFFILSFNNVFAYDIGTHAYLTDEIVNFYNQNYPNQKINNELKDYLIDGSRREDDPPRWMNHFYDPVYNRGLTVDPKIFTLKDIISVSIVNTVTFGSNWLSSKNWVQNSDNQNKTKYSPVIATILSSWQSNKIQDYFPTSDFTWEEAIRYWINGDEEMAMFTLGHVLHLIEDKTVPDHTRNDPHPGDSPYELYTQQFTVDNADKNLDERLKNKKPIVLNDLNFYFDELAKYSNNGFYSKDTVGIEKGYNLPEPDYFIRGTDGKMYGIKIDKEFSDYFLIKSPIKILILETDNEEFLKGNFIIPNYWTRLSTKSIQYGAGVINLFFQEVEKAKNNPSFVKEKEQSFFSQLVDITQSLFTQISSFFIDNSSGEQNQSTNQIVDSSVSPPIIDSQNEVQNIIKLQTQTSQPQQSALVDEQTQIIKLQNQLNDIKSQAESINQQINLLSQASANSVNFQANINSQSISFSSPQIIYGGGGGGGSQQNNQLTPAAENNSVLSNFENSSSTELATTTISTILEQASSTQANHIVISEILFDAQGSDEGKEFIEIYNPTNSDVDLKNWSLKILKSNSTTTSSLIKFGSKEEDILLIKSRGFLLAGFNGYNSTPTVADTIRSVSLPNSSSTIYLFDGDENEIDNIFYESNIAEGQSFERKAYQNDNCASAQNEGEFLGNGCDSDNINDFEIRDNPNPQNSINLPEPRNKPTAPQNFTAQYSSSTSEIILIWQEVQDYSGATSTLIYKISEINSTSSLVLSGLITTSTNTNILISEYGRDYQFEAFTVDKDGLNSFTSSVQIYIEAPQISTSTATSSVILLSQLDESSSTDSFAWIYQELGDGISGKLQSLELKMSSNSACQWFSFQEFDDANYSQQSRSFNSLSGLTVKHADGSVWNYQSCADFDWEKITIEFDNIEANPNKYYRLYFETGDNSRKTFFRGSASDYEFGKFKGCNLKNAVSGNGGVYSYQDCYEPAFDIYFILKGLQNTALSQ